MLSFYPPPELVFIAFRLSGLTIFTCLLLLIRRRKRSWSGARDWLKNVKLKLGFLSWNLRKKSPLLGPSNVAIDFLFLVESLFCNWFYILNLAFGSLVNFVVGEGKKLNSSIS